MSEKDNVTVVSTAKTNGEAPTMSDIANGNVEETKNKSASASEHDENKEVSETSNVVGDEKNQESESEDQTNKEEPKKPSKLQKRFRKLTGQISALQAEVQFLRGQNSAKDSKTVNTETEKKESTGRPNKDDFETKEAYDEALTDWKVEQKFAAEKAKAEKAKTEAEENSKATAFKQKIDDFKKEHDDFEDVIEGAEAPSKAVSRLILDSESPAELMYALAKNKTEYARICKLEDPFLVAREIGKFEAKFLNPDSKKETKETKTTTKAPPPVKPVGNKTTGSGKKSIFDKGLTQEEYEKLRDEGISA